VISRAAAPLLLTVMAALLVLNSLHKPLAYDEYDNLAYGYRLLTQGPGAYPFGQRMPVLALNALPCLADGCRLQQINASEAQLLTVRAPTMAFALLLAVVAYLWAAALFGHAGGLVALALAALNPNVLAHGKQVGSDVQVGFFMVAAAYQGWRLLRRAGGRRAFAWCALATAGALLSKLTGLLLFPALVILLARELVHRRIRPLSALRGAAAFAAAVLLLVNAGYAFKGTLYTARDYTWMSAAFQRLPRPPIPLLLPRVYVRQFDYSSFLQDHPEVARGRNYVLGRLNTEGTWYAVPLMVVLKNPLALFVLLVLGARIAGRDDEGWYLLLPAALVIAFFSLLARPQLGVRYVLPALPFLFVYAARAVGKWTSVNVALLAWYAVSTLSYHPHYMSYFNELIGPRINAYRFLADSNLDWEDRRYFVERFRQEHPEIPFVLAPAAPQTGWILVGANDLVGIFDADRFRWLREHFRPVRHVAYSYLLFYVDRLPP
jgi:hypothetical protein